MSLARLVYYSALIGGWAAFLGWLTAEAGLAPGASSGGRLHVVVTCALVGAAIGAGLNLVAGMANAQWRQQVKRLIPGLIAGGLGGAVGGFFGDVLFVTLGLPRAFGWMIMGAGIGVVEGLYDRAPGKVRNGLIGGSVGGLIGGFLFDPIKQLLASSTGMTSRATAFVILGLCVGALVGLVQVVLKEAWLTVLDGYRPGRQLILGQRVTVLGKAEYAALPFVGQSDLDLDWEHARVIREPGGRFVVEDNHSRLGVVVNGARVQGRAPLHDGDVIKIGGNLIQFSERRGGKKSAAPPASSPPASPSRGASPPPAVKPAPAPAPAPGAAPPEPPPAPEPKASTAVPLPRAPRPSPAPTVGTVPAGAVACPQCGRAVSKGQRYCIVCDLHF